MRPEGVLGFDPAPSDSLALVALSDVLRQAIRALVESRVALDRLGLAGSVWDGAVGVPIVHVLRRYSRQMSALEESLLGCLHEVDGWREGAERRRSEVAEITERVADLAGDPAADDRRGRLVATAREIGADHDRAAAGLTAAFEDLSACVDQVVRADDDLAGELDGALHALGTAIDEWVTAQAPELMRTAIALSEVAGLTTVASELVGVWPRRSAGDADQVSEIVSRSPASHRLIQALRRQWEQVAPASWPEATFGGGQTGGLAAALAGQRQPTSPSPAAGREGADREGADRLADGR